MYANIGNSYTLSIGRSNIPARHTARMARGSGRTVWLRVKEALRERHLPPTQNHVADMLKITQPSVSDWNKPGGAPKLEHAIILATKLNVCVEWIYTERGPKRPQPVDPVSQRLWDVWPLIDDLTKGEIVGRAVQAASADRPKSTDLPDRSIPA